MVLVVNWNIFLPLPHIDPIKNDFLTFNAICWNLLGNHVRSNGSSKISAMLQ